MAFSPRQIFNNDASFSPLFRLLDDFDHYSRQDSGNGHSRRSGLSSFQPRFDIYEIGDSYELHGELPGINKENVHIDFTDSQSMVISGKLERRYTAGTPPAGQIEGSTTSAAITEAESIREPNTGTSSEKKQGGGENSANKAKYWYSERSVGNFSRSFSFPTPVNLDAVSASLKDGILNIVVPKAKKAESRHIAIN